MSRSLLTARGAKSHDCVPAPAQGAHTALSSAAQRPSSAQRSPGAAQARGLRAHHDPVFHPDRTQREPHGQVQSLDGCQPGWRGSGGGIRHRAPDQHDRRRNAWTWTGRATRCDGYGGGHGPRWASRCRRSGGGRRRGGSGRRSWLAGAWRRRGCGRSRGAGWTAWCHRAAGACWAAGRTRCTWPRGPAGACRVTRTAGRTWRAGLTFDHYCRTPRRKARQRFKAPRRRARRGAVSPSHPSPAAARRSPC